MVGISIITTGLMLALFGGLIFAYPELLAYLLALGFLLLGIGLIVLGLTFRRFEKNLKPFRGW
jgi:hypothetical protein